MKLKQRIALWYLKRRIVAAYKKGLNMKPLPKWVAWIGNTAALAGVVGALAHVIPGPTGLLLAGVAAWLNSISHSLPGTGGAVQQ